MLAALLLGWSCASDAVDFGRDIRPILSNRCYKCHGPAVQQSGVRLDGAAHAAKKAAVVPRDPGASLLLTRVAAADDDERMPPPAAGPALSARERDLLRRWIADGAEYAPHWAFVPPVRPTLPTPDPHPVDAFVRQKLRAAGQDFAPPADRATLARRAFLDLLGLLPTPAERDEFLHDETHDAYEKLVERLLASPHYGERQARHWLDLARYADSNGYTVDGARSIWPWRDWVVQAFNDDLPFDRFTVAQLAGDLLPNATLAQRVATGFHRNTGFNEEGGADPEQFRVERAIDRTNTTFAAWLGLTGGCAQCHDHKYDPLPQADYYRLYAFFNSCDEPTMPVGGAPDLAAKVEALQAQANDLKKAGKLEEGKKLEGEMRKLAGKIPSTLVMRERKAPRPTFVQVRGDFLRPGARVFPGVPAALGPHDLPGAAANRLDLANWLVAPGNPLVARVFANRAWQQFFGRGLVETENDFGMQGSLPTHPELLDWLAAEFRADWSIKMLHRRIVLSATYRQSSAAPRAADPENRLWGRQNRLRVEAEIVRDVALCASGKLSRKRGGPPVFPPQPPELFRFTQSAHGWKESAGEDRFRRGLYTHLWRQSLHPLVATFDGADAQAACTRRARSNTPLQALHLANDPVFVELAAAFGRRVVAEGPTDQPGRAAYAFQLCFCRPPAAAEAARLLRYVAAQPGGAAEAWGAAGRVLFNLDEFITRE